MKNIMNKIHGTGFKFVLILMLMLFATVCVYAGTPTNWSKLTSSTEESWITLDSNVTFAEAVSFVNNKSGYTPNNNDFVIYAYNSSGYPVGYNSIQYLGSSWVDTEILELDIYKNYCSTSNVYVLGTITDPSSTPKYNDSFGTEGLSYTSYTAETEYTVHDTTKYKFLGWSSAQDDKNNIVSSEPTSGIYYAVWQNANGKVVVTKELDFTAATTPILPTDCGITWDATNKKLTLDGATIDNSNIIKTSSVVTIYVPDGTVIEVSKDSKVISGNTDRDKTTAMATCIGDLGTLTLNSNNNSTLDIWCGDADIIAGIYSTNLEIKNGNYIISYNSNPVQGLGIYGSNLKISGGTIKVKGQFLAVYGQSTLTIDTSTLTITGAKYVNSGGFTDEYVQGTTIALQNADSGYVTISPAHNWTYSVDATAKTITATCSDCGAKHVVYLSPVNSTELTVEVTEAGADDSVTWSSSDESIATVDANGKVTAVTEGTATITATSTVDTTVSNTIDITVQNRTTFKLSISVNGSAQEYDCYLKGCYAKWSDAYGQTVYQSNGESMDLTVSSSGDKVTFNLNKLFDVDGSTQVTSTSEISSTKTYKIIIQDS